MKYRGMSPYFEQGVIDPDGIGLSRGVYEEMIFSTGKVFEDGERRTAKRMRGENKGHAARRTEYFADTRRLRNILRGISGRGGAGSRHIGG